MKQQYWNADWYVAKGIQDPFTEMMGGGSAALPVTLPHDAMIFEERDPACPSGCQTGFYPAHSYTYTKRFTPPDAWKDGQTTLEFEGVMQKALVYLNGTPVARHACGYSPFTADLRPYLRYGAENELKVLAISSDQSSRWYPGAGIYRDVVLHTGGPVAVIPGGLRLTTRALEDGYAVIEAETALQSILPADREVCLTVTLFAPDGAVAAADTVRVTVPHNGTIKSRLRLTVEQPELWSPESPVLYRCRAEAALDGTCIDIAEEAFGIRTMTVDARRGLRLNGQSIKLRGACIHHDNGILGACTLPAAERFRVQRLKDAGFNAIRSAHHPAGKALLRACDTLGMLVMDELADMWDTPKNAHDLAFEFAGLWPDEVRSLVVKDWNHSCVILYSIGNELPEIGLPAGRIRARQLTDLLRKEDPTRFVTAGINGMLALRGLSQEESAGLAAFAQSDTSQTSAAPAPAQGSEGLNDVMGDLSFAARDALTTLPAAGRALDEISGTLDVVGLNYMPARYELEHRMHPDRVLVGSESYPTEIAHLWELVEAFPYVIGDFTWTGYDYLGEAGIGSFHYDKHPQGQGFWPDRLAYCGDIDLTGCRRPVSYLREIAFGLRIQPYISVERVDCYGQGCMRNHWKYDDALESWTFPGWEGKPARVKVLCAAPEVELFLNGISLGRKSAGQANGYTAVYELHYQPGQLTAVGYDGGIETGRMELSTAGVPVQMQLSAGTDTLVADGRDVLLLTATLSDEQGRANLWEKREISISVSGPAVLAGFGSAAPSGGDSYQASAVQTYDGRVIAAVRSTFDPGTAMVRLTAPGIQDAVFTVLCRAQEQA